MHGCMHKMKEKCHLRLFWGAMDLNTKLEYLQWRKLKVGIIDLGSLKLNDK
jgi:hypothetical protein